MDRLVAVGLFVVVATCFAVIAFVAGVPSDHVDAASDDATELVVAVDVPADAPAGRYETDVGNASTYWTSHAEQYLDRQVAFTVDPDAADPDLVVSVVDEIERCGLENHTAGCAPVVGRPATVSDPIEVRVRSGLAPGSTRLVLKHEFGHVMGLEHDDPPQSVMASHVILATTPKPNATRRAVPWASSNLSLAADLDDVPRSDRVDVRRQIRHAIDYYNDGADGTVPSNVTVTLVDDPDAADVSVEFRSTLPCGDGAGSCSMITGTDPDRDGAKERYTSVEIFLSGVETDVVGWHVGRWLGTALGAADEDDLPPPFRDGNTSAQREHWWRASADAEEGS